MQIKHFSMNKDNIDFKLFKKLLDNQLYTENGVFRQFFTYPEFYIKDETYVSIMTYRRRPISVMFVSKNMYGGWEEFNILVPETFGLIGFYTHPDFRGNSYSRKIFEDFDKIKCIRKLSTSPRCEGILKSVDKKDLVIVHDA